MSDFFSRFAARAPDATAGWRTGEPVPQGELVRRVRAWTALARRTEGRDVALFHEDALEFAAALLGAWQAGKTVWIGADVLPASCDALRGAVQSFWGQYPEDCTPCSPAAADCCPLPWTEPAPDFPALVVHTSGTTGEPQAIAKRMSQLTGEVAALETQFGARAGQAEIVATVSHQHIYGLLFRVLWPLAAGRAIHAQRYDHPEMLAQSLGQRPCVLVASPAHLKRIPEHLDWRAARAQLRAVFSSGGMLPAEASLRVRSLLGRVPVEVYGSSESGGIAWREREDGAGAAWLPLPGVQWRIAEPGEQLEVCSSHAGPAGWVPMADRVEACGDGGFLLRGRSDRIVKIEEKRVSLDALELVLTGSGLAAEARVIAATIGERQALAAFVVPSAAGRALLDEGGRAALNKKLRDRLKGTVEAVALPRRWRYLPGLPVDAQGKTSYRQLLALLGDEGEARPRLPAVSVLDLNAEQVLLELTIPANLLYFDGHFPVAPVLPGVVQVDWAIYYGRRHFDLGPVFHAVHALKFQQIIRAGLPVQLELVHDRAKGNLNFRYFSEAGAHASGRIHFGTE